MNLPLSLTVLRIFFVPLIVVLMLTKGNNMDIWAVVVFLLASATDLADGYLARKRRQVTALGILLDPLADKLLTASAFISLVWLHLVPAWMVVIIVGRELAVTGLRSIASAQGLLLQASELGKTKMVLQVAAATVIGSPRVALGSDSCISGAGDLLDEIAVARQCGVPAGRLYDLVTSLGANILNDGSGSAGVNLAGDFIALRDRDRTVQGAIDPDTPEAFAIAEEVRSEFVLKVSGTVRPRPGGAAGGAGGGQRLEDQQVESSLRQIDGSVSHNVPLSLLQEQSYTSTCRSARGKFIVVIGPRLMGFE